MRKPRGLAEEALAYARSLHAGQVDKAGAPYSGHLERVAAAVRAAGGDPVAVAAAALHDAVEDGHIDLAELRERFGSEVAEEVDALSRRAGETYRAFIERLAPRPRARLCKLADLRDNSDLARLPAHPPELRARQARLIRERYAPALAYLLDSAAGQPAASSRV